MRNDARSLLLPLKWLLKAFFSLTLSYTLGLVWLDVFFGDSDVVFGGDWIMVNPFPILHNIAMIAK